DARPQHRDAPAPALLAFREVAAHRDVLVLDRRVARPHTLDLRVRVGRPELDLEPPLHLRAHRAGRLRFAHERLGITRGPAARAQPRAAPAPALPAFRDVAAPGDGLVLDRRVARPRTVERRVRVGRPELALEPPLHPRAHRADRLRFAHERLGITRGPPSLAA